MARFFRRALLVISLIGILFGSWVVKGFYYVESNEVGRVNDRALLRTGVQSLWSFNTEIQEGLWWYAPGVQELEKWRIKSWKYPTWNQLVNAYKYLTLKEQEARKDWVGIDNNEELEAAADELLLIFAAYSDDYKITDWTTVEGQIAYKPTEITFFKYDREWGWRLGGQYSYKDESLTVNEMYRLSKPWGGNTIRDTLAHELWHAQGQWIVMRSDSPDLELTWGQVWQFYTHINESFTQVGSADVLVHARDEFGPKYDAAIYSFFRSIVGGYMVWMAWYDGDSLGNMPLSTASVDIAKFALKRVAERREWGKPVCEKWFKPYLGANRFRDISGFLYWEINKRLWTMRQDAMQKEYLDLRAWASGELPSNEIYSARLARFKKWLRMPETHGAALMEYNVMPLLLLLNTKSDNDVASYIYLSTPFGQVLSLLGFEGNGVVPEFWENMADADYAETLNRNEYIGWLAENSGLNEEIGSNIGEMVLSGFLTLFGIVLFLHWYLPQRKAEPRQKLWLHIVPMGKHGFAQTELVINPCKTRRYITTKLLGDVWVWVM